MRFRASILPILVIAFCATLIAGCRLFDSNPGVSDPASMPLAGGKGDPGIVKSISFMIRLPDQTSSQPASGNEISIAGIRSSTVAPTVLARLTLVNYGNPAQPYHVIQKSVAVDIDTGTAIVVFTDVPALPCVGEVQITGGKIGSYNEFHGAADLIANADNQIVLGPKAGGTMEDISAQAILRIIQDPDLFAKAGLRLYSQISASLAGLDLRAPSILDDVIAAYVILANKAPAFETGTIARETNTVVSADGGTIAVANPESPVNGLEVRFPSGYYPVSTDVTISVMTIQKALLSPEFKPITPLISIYDGGACSDEPVEVKIPAKVSNGSIPVAARYDPVTGRFESLPVIEVDSENVTIATNDLTGLRSPSASTRQVLDNSGSLIEVAGFFVLFEMIEADLPDAVDSGFRPNVNMWKNVNRGTFLHHNGHCAGSVISALWAFSQKVNPAIYGNYDPNKTDSIWEDDIHAIRLNSVIQGECDWTAPAGKLADKMSSISDEKTLKYFKAALHLTRQPQLIAMYSISGGHALIVYRVEGNTLYIADPNFPGVERTLSLSDGTFPPFSASLNSEAAAINFTKVSHLGAWSFVSRPKMAARWSEFMTGTIGKGVFPRLELLGKKDDDSFASLKNDFAISDDTIRVALRKDGALMREFGLIFYEKDASCWLPDAMDSSTWSDRLVFDIPLEQGENELGLRIGLLPEGKTATWKDGTNLWYLPDNRPAAWADFQWFRILFLPPPEEPAVAPGNTSIKASWNAVKDAKGYRVYWQDSPGVATLTAEKADVTENSYLVNGLENEKTYYFVVTTRGLEFESKLSEEVSTKPSDKRFTRSSNGIVTDGKTGMQWFCGPLAAGRTWQQNKEWIESLTVGGGGWRLPTLAETQELYEDSGKVNIAPYPVAWLSGLFTVQFVWTSDVDDSNPKNILVAIADLSQAGNSWYYLDGIRDASIAVRPAQ